MPTLKVYPHGLTGGVAPSVTNRTPPKRGDVSGWSNASTRSNTRFLYSVEPGGLHGTGLALSLTVRDCPKSHAEWAAMRRAMQMRLTRLGMVRMHWLTEWQRRGVPHLHAAVWFRESPHADVLRLARLVSHHWLEVAGKCGARLSGQHVTGITDEVGWFKYLSKHAVRGLHHYQRSPESVPQGWSKTGRMWGYVGAWPLREEMRLELDQAGWFRFRRLVRSWRRSDARAAGCGRRLSKARRMLRCRDRALSEVRGVSEWIPQDDALRLVATVAALGHRVEQVWQTQPNSRRGPVRA